MKKIFALTLALALLLCGCGGANAAAPETTAPAAVEETQTPTTEPTTVPTTEPVVYRNPLNGELLDAPFTDRIFANTVSNMAENLPHVGVTQADVLIETFVNKNNIIRCLALYTDIEDVEAIGSTRSTRPIFNQLAQHYDLILSHAGGSSQALEDAANRGIDNFNIDAWEVSSQGTSYRDKEYNRTYENTLFGIGAGIKAYAEAQGMESAVKVSVTVSESEITDVTIDVSGETAGYGADVGEPMKESILEAQSAEVDGISGATNASNDARALLAAIETEGKPGETITVSSTADAE